MVPGMLLCRLPSQLQLLHNIIPVIEKKNTAKKKVYTTTDTTQWYNIYNIYIIIYRKLKKKTKKRVYTTTDTTQWFCGKLLNLLPVFM